MIPAISQQANLPVANTLQFASKKTEQDEIHAEKKRVTTEVTETNGDLKKQLAQLKAKLETLEAEKDSVSTASSSDKVVIAKDKGLGTTAARAALKTADEVMGSYKDVKLLQRPFAFLYPARLKKAFKNTREYYKSLTPEDKLRSWVGVAWQVLVDTTMGALTFGGWQGAQLFAQGLHSSSLIRRFYAEVMTDYNENRKAKKEHSPKETSKPAEPTDTKADKK